MALFTTEAKIPTVNNLDDLYMVPPFSIISRTDGRWKHNRHRWKDIFPDSSDGRDTKWYNALPANVMVKGKKKLNTDDRVSIFDPFLCEVLYNWFSAEGDKILDPFSGGSARGIVASALNRNYTGIDLSIQQIMVNKDQYNDVKSRYEYTGTAEWINGDSEFALDDIEDGTYQMLFTCPPYYNLEQYTRDMRDLSRQDSYDSFIYKYTTILNKAVAKLDMNAGCFAVIVVSEIRDPITGIYYGFVPDTINIFRNAGMKYYNEIILEDPIGSLVLRGPKYFKQSRKIGRHHQNILVFYGGEIDKIRERCEVLNKSSKFPD